jgi:uncharacterized protein YndB with AHSA1/START domain
MKHWTGPSGDYHCEVTSDLRVGGSCRIVHERFADRDARDRHNQGWVGGLARLDRYLSN